MKSLFRLPNLLILAVAVFAFSACTDDPDFAIPPSVDLLADAGFLSADATITAGTPIIVKISAAKGDNPMKSLEFQQDGARISDISRITIDGAPASSAAELLFDGEVDAFTKEVTITPHADGVADYTFIVADEAGETSSQTITITIEVPSDPPTLVATQGLLNLSGTAGGFVGIELKADRSLSEALLTSFTIYEGNAIAAGAGRFLFGSTPIEGSIDLTGTDEENGFTVSLAIKANDVGGEVDFYTLVVEDANGLKDSLEISLTAAASDVKVLNGILFNRAGMTGTGGLDLDDGIGTGSSDPIAEIRDEGVDIGQAYDLNWKQQIAGINGSVLKSVAAGTIPDGGTYSDVSTKAAIQGIFDTNSTIAVSQKIAVGDLFIVANNGNNYFIQVTEVNVTPDDNEDNYVFNIKY